MSCLPIRALPAVALMWSAAAWGAERTVLLVGELPSEADAAIRRQLSRRGVTVKELADYPIPQKAREQSRAKISQVETTLRRIEEKYYRIELEGMLADLRVELERSSTDLVTGRRWDLLRALLLWQGVGLARSAKKPAALRSFAAAIAVGASPPKAGRFPPAVLALYTRAAQMVAARTKSRLALKVSPAAAVIEIDGRKITDSSIELATGTHWVVARAIGFETTAKKIVMEGARTLELKLEQASVSQIAQQVAEVRAGGTLDPTRLHVAAALGRLAGTAEVLVVQQRDQATAGKLVSFSRIRSGDGTLLGRQAELVSSSSQSQAARRAIGRLWPRAAVVDSRKKRRRPFYKKWWFWTAVGVAAVAGTTAAILATADWKDTYTINLVRP